MAPALLLGVRCRVGLNVTLRTLVNYSGGTLEKEICVGERLLVRGDDSKGNVAGSFGRGNVGGGVIVGLGVKVGKCGGAYPFRYLATNEKE